MGPKLSWSLLTSLIGAIFLKIYIYIYLLLSLLFFPSIVHLLETEKNRRQETNSISGTIISKSMTQLSV